MSVASTAVLVACASGSKETLEPVVEGDSGGVRTGVTLPIEEFALKSDDLLKIAKAEAVLLKRCMSRAGEDFNPPLPKPDSGISGELDRRYGVISETVAREYGYHLPEMSKISHGATSAEPISPRQKQLLYGTPSDESVGPGGCFGEVQRELREKHRDAAGAEIAQTISTESYKKSMESPIVRELFKSWSSCMKGRGFNFGSPIDSISNRSYMGPTVSDEEKKVALADVACKERIGLVGAWNREESRIQEGEIVKNAGPLASLKESQAALLRRSEEVIRSAVAEAAPPGV
ncbi:hypothetical protein ACWENO_19510 [Streptomyces sp. NPDC004436]